MFVQSNPSDVLPFLLKCKLKYLRINKFANLQICILAYLHTCLLAYWHTCILAYLCTCTCLIAYLHTPQQYCTVPKLFGGFTFPSSIPRTSFRSLKIWTCPDLKFFIDKYPFWTCPDFYFFENEISGRVQISNLDTSRF